MEIKNRITEIRKVRLGDIIHNPRNWRSHPDLQRKAFRATLEEIGWAGVPLAYNSERTGGLTFVDGHMRKEENPDLIVEVAITDLDDGEADNLLARYDVLPDMAEPIPDLTLDLLGSVGTECEALGDVWEAMTEEMALLLDGGGQEIFEPLTAKDKRNPLVDVIYTFGNSDATCCIAHKSGLLYGARSTDPICDRHPIVFIDNEFKDYKHEHHKRVVGEHGPKYATVRDIMSEEQCKKADIAFFGFTEVMRFAEEMESHCQNVIVIPKYDCLDDIPEKYVLGYSIPTTYAGTPLPIEMFEGRRVHLLGGSPKRQYKYWQAIPNSVVSIDTNFINILSTHGALRGLNLINEVVGLGLPMHLQGRDSLELHDFGLINLPNPFYVAFAINCGYYLALFSAGLKEISNSLAVAVTRLIKTRRFYLCIA